MSVEKANSMKKRVAIIPSRYSSSRLPGKPLADICGLPMIVHVCQRAINVPGIDMVVVATDHEEIGAVVNGNGFKAVMTAKDHASGTDRVAEAAGKLGLQDEDIVVNIQGDQPLLETAPLEAMVELLVADEGFHMTTAACPLEMADLDNPNRVKVVLDRGNGAIYFSRSPIPYDRDRVVKDLLSAGRSNRPGFPGYLRHLGLYAFKNAFLRKFVSLEQGMLERIEMLEQLRAIENGYRIGVAVVDNAPVEVDTHEDLEAVRRIVAAKGG